jgi:phosphotransferase system enzyme I (PtsI)
MVEVPSVALQANVYAKEVDFLSIGTNDLTQYALAVDRGNERISDLYDQRHPAVWKLIKEVVDGTRNTDTSVSVCGELASDPVAACCMVGMGITDLSMSPGKLSAVKRYLRAFSMKELENLSKKILSCDTLAEIDQVYDEIKTQMTENS